MKTPSPTSWRILLFALFVTLRAAGQFSPVALPTGLQPTESEMVVYQNNLYLVLQNATHDSFSLHKYNGSVFTAVPLPASYKLYPDTQFEEVNGQLYFMPDHTAGDLVNTAELMRYDGTILTAIDIPDAIIPSDILQLSGHHPFAFGNTLYIEAVHLDSITFDLFTQTVWIKYDGTTFSRMQVPYRFTCQPVGEPARPSDKRIYQDKIYMRYQDHITGRRELISFDGTTVSVETMHPDEIALPGGCDMEVYNGNLYIPTSTPTSPDRPFAGKLDRYNGTAITAVTIPASLNYAKTTLAEYGGKLYGAMHDASVAPRWYAYDGTTFTLVPTPSGTAIHPAGDQQVFQCKLYINLQIGIYAGTLIHALYTYSDIAACSIIPLPFERFDGFDIRNYRRERDWCWTGPDIDWSITPCTLPDCIDPLVRLSLLDKDSKTVWSETYQKPFSTVFPVEDKQPLTEVVALGQKDKTFQNALIFDKDLVPGGIQTIGLSMKPKQNKVQLVVETQKGQTVPIVMALLDGKGKTLWQEKFVAPLNTQINAVSSQRGVTLRFTLAEALKGITSVSIFPNPAVGTPAIDIATNGTKVPATVTITNFNGKTVYQKNLTAPIIDHPDLSSATPGLYIVTVTGGVGSAYKQTIVIK